MEDPALNWKKYLLTYIAALLLILFVIGGANLLIDPHGRLRWVDIDNFNNIKFTFKNHGRIGKANSIIQCTYDAVILGSSRAETGLNPAHTAFGNRSVFNAALKAASMYELNRMAAHVLQQQNPEIVIIGLDFIAFNGQRQISDDFAESPLASQQSTRSLLRYALSLETLQESWLTADWNMRRSIKPCEYKGYAGQGRPRGLPRIAFDTMYKRFVTNDALYANYIVSDEHMSLLGNSLRELTKSGVQVYIFISPVHASHIEIISQLDLLIEFEDWKRELVRVTESVNSDLNESNKITLWDFSGYNSITMEAVPPEANEKYMSWYRDSSHYSSRTGNLILNQILNPQNSMHQIPEDFGIPLNSATIENYLQQQRSKALQYRNEQPAEIKHIKMLIRSMQENDSNNLTP
jgi:hypothetical protein